MDLKNRLLEAKKKIFRNSYSFLNDKQKEAVFSTEGPLLVLAGAGSGKTTVLVQRISFIIKYGNAYFNEEVPEEVIRPRHSPSIDRAAGSKPAARILFVHATVLRSRINIFYENFVKH